MLKKQFNIPQDQVKLISLLDVNSQKIILFNINNEKENKYLSLPHSLDVYKDQNQLFLIVKNEKNSFLFSSYYNIISKFLKESKKIYVKKLILRGRGFKITKLEQEKEVFLRFKIGFSHLVDYKVPLEKISVFIKKNKLHFRSSDLIFLGNFCKKIKNLKRLNSYNGKGFKLKREFVKLKTFKKK